MNEYDMPFAKLTKEQSRELAEKMDGGMGMGKRPPKKEKKPTATKQNKLSPLCRYSGGAFALRYACAAYDFSTALA